MKQILGIILAVIIVMGIIPTEGIQFVMEVCAEETAPTSGTCGKNGGGTYNGKTVSNFKFVS